MWQFKVTVIVQGHSDSIMTVMIKNLWYLVIVSGILWLRTILQLDIFINLFIALWESFLPSVNMENFNFLPLGEGNQQFKLPRWGRWVSQLFLFFFRKKNVKYDVTVQHLNHQNGEKTTSIPNRDFLNLYNLNKKFHLIFIGSLLSILLLKLNTTRK